MTGGRTPALIALLLLGGVLLVVLAVTTPWTPLPAPRGVSLAVDARRDFSSAEFAREKAYRSDVRPPAYAGMLVGLLVAAVLGLTPIGARIVTAAARPFGGGWWVAAVIGGIAITIIGRLATLAFDGASERVRRRYGLSTQSWSSWLVDQAKALAIAAVLLVITLSVFYALARRTPRHWWAWAAGAGVVLVLATSFVYPVVIEPVFNKFTSMPPGPLRDSLMKLAAEDGVPVRDVLVADASRRTTALNAYVSGFGSTRRIVVYDTLVTSAPQREVELVVAHELGHAERQDVLVGTAIGALALAATMPLLWLLLTPGLLRRAGATAVGDPRSVALLMFIIALMTLVTTPIGALVSRRVEARADVHSLDLTRDAQSFVEVERRLALTNLSDLEPNPIVYGLFFTHPSTPERIALARTWARLNGAPEPADLRPAE
ncbi:MAG: M48 family metallopeptidase [Mycobacteriales bacterium]